ncbi:pyrroline-5-carboxylate reductase [Candidatus Magnetomonas plexicatena]|uniref:pyrroline-5-carboxylate reductase n=1 Tax=Candidatus Magnetomonas plexicatena TaxID=2552947 RepID=UPI001C7980D2|nr:pyrroline-5-carboxylate reductase [Nitrospirales bacterium LBB_01]
MKIGFIGGGNMAEALIKGLTEKGQDITRSSEVDTLVFQQAAPLVFVQAGILVSEPVSARCYYLKDHYHVTAMSDNITVLKASDTIIIAIKPQNMPTLKEQVQGIDFTGKTVMSIVAGIKLAALNAMFPGAFVVRVMPNTPALVLEAMSVVTSDTSVPKEILKKAEGIFSAIGQVVFLSEDMMDAVTAVSGSGPAFFALFTKCVIEAGVALGLPDDISSKLAIQTMTGTAKLLSSGQLPAELIKMVASPGGTTEAGLKKFEALGLKNIVSEALQSAAHRSAELGK